jgi:SARP family transcriptional regulator, regulator of embCAB operon
MIGPRVLMPTFYVLGPMEVRTPGHIFRPRGTMMQTLLAAFLAASDRLVGANALVEELWGGTPPAKSDNALQAQISRLRRDLARLEPERKDSRLATTDSGYHFKVDWTELDAWLFMHTVESIRLRPPTDLRRDVTDLRSALKLWRGPIFGGLTGGPICQTAVRKYEESRIAALEFLYDLQLKAGDHATIVPELTELVAQNPLQEHFCSLLMVALYQSGRQIDALNVYHRIKQRLAEDLGIEPSPVLRRYEAAILNHDPLLVLSDQLDAADRGAAARKPTAHGRSINALRLPRPTGAVRRP